jgi:hypothetical protein
MPFINPDKIGFGLAKIFAVELVFLVIIVTLIIIL